MPVISATVEMAWKNGPLITITLCQMRYSAAKTLHCACHLHSCGTLQIGRIRAHLNFGAKPGNRAGAVQILVTQHAVFRRMGRFDPGGSSFQWEKLKGCDIGYGLAANSCEGVNNVDACTVTAPDAIAAFAAPNPNGTSQNRRFFRVRTLLQVTLPSEPPSLLWTGDR